VKHNSATLHTLPQAELVCFIVCLHREDTRRRLQELRKRQAAEREAAVETHEAAIAALRSQDAQERADWQQRLQDGTLHLHSSTNDGTDPADAKHSSNGADTDENSIAAELDALTEHLRTERDAKIAAAVRTLQRETREHAAAVAAAAAAEAALEDAAAAREAAAARQRAQQWSVTTAAAHDAVRELAPTRSALTTQSRELAARKRTVEAALATARAAAAAAEAAATEQEQRERAAVLAAGAASRSSLAELGAQLQSLEREAAELQHSGETAAATAAAEHEAALTAVHNRVKVQVAQLDSAAVRLRGEVRAAEVRVAHGKRMLAKYDHRAEESKV
jgi:hypothetical protein